MGGAYYNEIDPFAAAWLRELIAGGHIAPGVVDERSIEDVIPSELAGFTQCHFFAGIGVWSYALRRAGWPDDRPIWTGSCPCQPFSAAGKGGGFGDERHLWPAWQWLIEQCDPECLAGEQVGNSNAGPWLDLVQADLEGMGYAFGCVPVPAAGFGAPHIRDRDFWVAYSAEQRHDGRRTGQACDQSGQVQRLERLRLACGLADALCDGAEHAPGQGLGAQAAADCGDRGISGQRLRAGIEGPAIILADSSFGGQPEFGDALVAGGGRHADGGFVAGGLGDANSAGPFEGSASAAATGYGRPAVADGGAGRPGPTNGFWRNADWLCCTDGKWRPVEPGTFPLAHGAPARVGRLRGYGNAINAEVATGFIQAVIAHLHDGRLAA